MFVKVMQAINGKDTYPKAGGDDRSHETHEEAVVFGSNAVVYPRAVMVISLNTLIAYTTMSRPRSSDH
jgi:hypothetical protein